MSCRCSENKPGEMFKLFQKLNWRVVNRYCNYSAFNGYKKSFSDYSLIRCLKCGMHWRTKANYVSSLKDLK